MTTMVSRRKRDLTLAVLLFARGATAACNVCRNGGQVVDPGHGFQMVDGVTGETVDWTCGWLEESVADVDPSANGAPGEAFLCGLAQLWAERECACTGPPVPPLSDNVVDPNPSCDFHQNPEGWRFVGWGSFSRRRAPRFPVASSPPQ